MKNLQKNWVLRIERGVWKTVEKFPQDIREKIAAVIRELVIDPYAGDAMKIQGVSDDWRRRMGAYRIFYRILKQEGIIVVFAVVRRSSNTY